MKISKLAKNIGIDIDANDLEIESFATLDTAQKNQIAYIDNESYIELLKTTNAGAVILQDKYFDLLPEGCIGLVSSNPHLSMAYASKYFAQRAFVDTDTNKSISKSAEVCPSATICDNVVIEENVTIMSGVRVGANVKIGKNSIVYPNVVIYDNTVIGENCILQAGCIIASDGYGYVPTAQGEHIKIHHFGNVVLEDDVEIGANTTIDRGVFGSTTIGSGTKVDNLVQIAHNCELGDRCIIVSQVGISGSSKLGRNVVMGGQSATAGHLEIGDFATIAARGGVSKSVIGGKTYAGFPLQEHKEWIKGQVRMINFFKKKKKDQ